MKKSLKPLLASLFLIPSLASLSQAQEGNKESFLTRDGLNSELEYTCTPLRTQLSQRAAFTLEGQNKVSFFEISHIQDSFLQALTTSIRKGEVDFKAILFVTEDAQGNKQSGLILNTLNKIKNDKNLRVGVGISQRLGEKYVDLITLPKDQEFSEAIDLLLSTPISPLVNIDKSKHPFEDIFYINSQVHADLIKKCIESED